MNDDDTVNVPDPATDPEPGTDRPPATGPSAIGTSAARAILAFAEESMSFDTDAAVETHMTMLPHAASTMPLHPATSMPLDAATSMPLDADTNMHPQADTNMSLHAETTMPPHADTNMPLHADATIHLHADTNPTIDPDTPAPPAADAAPAGTAQAGTAEAAAGDAAGPPAVRDADLRDRERRRIGEYRVKALADPDPLLAVIGAANAGIFDFAADFAEALRDELAAAPSTVERLAALQPFVDDYQKLLRQGASFAAIETQERRAEREARRRAPADPLAGSGRAGGAGLPFATGPAPGVRDRANEERRS